MVGDKAILRASMALVEMVSGLFPLYWEVGLKRREPSYPRTSKKRGGEGRGSGSASVEALPIKVCGGRRTQKDSPRLYD